MKLWPFLIGIILICALVSSPVLAMSKSDLIASYHDESRKVFKPPIFPEEYGTIKDLRNWSIKPTPVPTWIPWSSKDDSSFPRPSFLPNTSPTQVPSKWPSWDSSDATDLSCCSYGPVPQTFGSIEVSSIPSGANVYLDGTLKGTTPITISGVKTVSVHEVKMTKSGYSVVRYNPPNRLYDGETIDISVTEGETVRVSAVLIPTNDVSKVGLKL
jgi:hypothetical protein